MNSIPYLFVKCPPVPYVTKKKRGAGFTPCSLFMINVDFIPLFDFVEWNTN